MSKLIRHSFFSLGIAVILFSLSLGHNLLREYVSVPSIITIYKSALFFVSLLGLLHFLYLFTMMALGIWIYFQKSAEESELEKRYKR